MTKPLIIGVTGGIATGKSTVLVKLAELGATTIDADSVYHELITPGQPLHRTVIEQFGPGILAADGTIDRAALGGIVFSDIQRLRELERLTHPAVRAEILRRIAGAATPVVAVDAVKLIEGGLYRHCDEVCLVTADHDAQRQRLMLRNAIGPGDADRRLAAQPDTEAQLPFATRVLDNSGSREAFESAVLDAWVAATSAVRD